MRGCGTVFHPNQLTGEDIDKLRGIEQIASKHEFIAANLRNAVSKCEELQSTEGLAEMVAFTFNAQQYTPNYGGGGANLPVGKYKGVIVDAAQERSKGGGGFLALILTPIEGPLAGQKHIDRLNLHHTNPQTVQIANEQLSAYCHVIGVFNIQDTQQLCNIPFLFEIGWQKGHEPTAENPAGGYTEVKAIADVNGNAPGKAGTGPAADTQQQPPAAATQQQPPATIPPAGVGPATGAPAGWGGAPAAQPAAPATGGGWGSPAGGAAPASTPAPAGGGWGGPPAGGGAAPPGWGA
jgi:hypothetical protein